MFESLEDAWRTEAGHGQACERRGLGPPAQGRLGRPRPGHHARGQAEVPRPREVLQGPPAPEHDRGHPPRSAIRARQRRHAQEDAHKAAGEKWRDSDPVLTTRNGTPIEPRDFNRAFAAHRRRAGVPTTCVHDTRHTRASLLAALDVHPRVAMRILRHSQISMARTSTRGSRLRKLAKHLTGSTRASTARTRHILPPSPQGPSGSPEGPYSHARAFVHSHEGMPEWPLRQFQWPLFVI
ncbi:tyrosine-type recombinase/integrase [Streptosporangium sandarakinum]